MPAHLLKAFDSGCRYSHDKTSGRSYKTHKNVMEAKLNVKDKSVATFLEERLLGYKKDERREQTGSVSAYHLMKDVMFFKKDCGIQIGETVKIELFDRAQFSDKELVNTYV